MTRAVTEVESFEIIWCKYTKLCVFANPAGNSKGLGEKRKIPTGGGVNAFWIFRRHWGVKMWKLSIGGYGYFLESPNIVMHGVILTFKFSNSFVLLCRMTGTKFLTSFKSIFNISKFVFSLFSLCFTVRNSVLPNSIFN